MKLNKPRDFGKTGIYCIKSFIDNKVYIGKAKCIYKRIKAHITALNTKNKDENRHLINAWHKYGKDNFSYSVIEYLELDDTILSKQELYWQLKLNSIDRKFGYNLRLDSNTKCIVSNETKLLLSKAKRNRKLKFPDLDRQVGKKVSKFWKDNPEVVKEMGKKVAEALRKYRIAKLDFDTMEILDVCNSKEEFKLKYPDYYYQAILGCCNGTKNSYRGFKWGYIEISTDKLINNKPITRKFTRRKEMLNYKTKEQKLQLL